MKNLLVALALAFVLPALAGAETLYNQDGVRLSATVQKIEPGAAICRVREVRHSAAEEYARLKPNDGQALDVWRVELVVANYSGKVLDYLNAHLNVASTWPPCDHWDGPERGYGKPVVWTGPLMSIQEVGSVQPGEEVRAIEFVLAWHEDDPELGRWDIDYDFAAAAREPTGNPTAPRPEQPQAPAAKSADNWSDAKHCRTTTTGEEYCYVELENQPGCWAWYPWTGERATTTWSGNCTGGLAEGAGLLVWTLSGTVADAEGEMRNGKLNGRWTVRFHSGTVQEGRYVDGLKNGHWSQREADGDEYEGSFVNNLRNGHFTHRWHSGTVEEGPYVDGKRNGHWVLRQADGDVTEGTYVDGEKHGHWTSRDADGTWQQGSYVNGERHGRWSFPQWDREDCYANGNIVPCP